MISGLQTYFEFEHFRQVSLRSKNQKKIKSGLKVKTPHWF